MSFDVRVAVLPKEGFQGGTLHFTKEHIITDKDEFVSIGGKFKDLDPSEFSAEILKKDKKWFRILIKQKGEPFVMMKTREKKKKKKIQGLFTAMDISDPQHVESRQMIVDENIMNSDTNIADFTDVRRTMKDMMQNPSRGRRLRRQARDVFEVNNIWTERGVKVAHQHMNSMRTSTNFEDDQNEIYVTEDDLFPNLDTLCLALPNLEYEKQPVDEKSSRAQLHVEEPAIASSEVHEITETECESTTIDVQIAGEGLETQSYVDEINVPTSCTSSQEKYIPVKDDQQYAGEMIVDVTGNICDGVEVAEEADEKTAFQTEYTEKNTTTLQTKYSVGKHQYEKLWAIEKDTFCPYGKKQNMEEVSLKREKKKSYYHSIQNKLLSWMHNFSPTYMIEEDIGFGQTGVNIYQSSANTWENELVLQQPKSISNSVGKCAWPEKSYIETSPHFVQTFENSRQVMGIRERRCIDEQKLSKEEKEKQGKIQDDQDYALKETISDHQSDQDYALKESISDHRSDQEYALKETSSDHQSGQDYALKESISDHQSDQDSALKESISDHRSDQDYALKESISDHQSDQDYALKETISDHQSDQDYALKETSSDHQSDKDYALKESSSDHQSGEDYALKETISDHQSGQDYALKETISDHISDKDYALKETSSDHQSDQDFALKETSSDHQSGQDYALKETISDHQSDQDYALKETSSDHQSDQDYALKETSSDHNLDIDNENVLSDQRKAVQHLDEGYQVTYTSIEVNPKSPQNFYKSTEPDESLATTPLSYQGSNIKQFLQIIALVKTFACTEAAHVVPVQCTGDVGFSWTTQFLDFVKRLLNINDDALVPAFGLFAIFMAIYMIDRRNRYAIQRLGNTLAVCDATHMIQNNHRDGGIVPFHVHISRTVTLEENNQQRQNRILPPREQVRVVNYSFTENGRIVTQPSD